LFSAIPCDCNIFHSFVSKFNSSVIVLIDPSITLERSDKRKPCGARQRTIAGPSRDQGLRGEIEFRAEWVRGDSLKDTMVASIERTVAWHSNYKLGIDIQVGV
jgi:hypothetical protein